MSVFLWPVACELLSAKWKMSRFCLFYLLPPCFYNVMQCISDALEEIGLRQCLTFSDKISVLFYLSSCVYWDYSESAWSKEGCTKKVSS